MSKYRRMQAADSVFLNKHKLRVQTVPSLERENSSDENTNLSMTDSLNELSSLIYIFF